MVKRIFILLMIAYFSYSLFIYAYSTNENDRPSSQVLSGFLLWQKNNCQACHQLYGLGGYMGPDLTNIVSDTAKGALFATAFIRAGSLKMPNFNFTDNEVSDLISFLTWVDKSGKTVVPDSSVTPFGNYHLDKH
jgi:nitric oxide reductase subunit C